MFVAFMAPALGLSLSVTKLTVLESKINYFWVLIFGPNLIRLQKHVV